ncbi:ABC transporter permease [Thermoflavimicrobium daqui]|jgi:ABC-2 type transport system permease protein|uniref:ABC transporter permease n=1 Tax=Thermoflavimicrobium daqui TaxID=2137476 RepID=A0A364K9C4_9BACL|nr:ABC transporter permease [Thermoflavimicrobium daqui]RAL26895.1 hypothetical protein DL897_02275 [Thermoflavimicrobium daqui]
MVGNLIQNELMKFFVRKRTWVYFIIFYSIPFLFILIYFFKTGSAWQKSFIDFALVFQLSFIGIYTTILAATTVAEEYVNGTIKQLLIRPYSRTNVLLSKYFAVFLMLLFQLIGTYLIAYILTWFFTIEKVYFSLFIRDLLYALILQTVYMTIAFMIATLTRKSALAIALTIFLQLTQGLSSFINMFYPFLSKYYLFGLLNLGQLPEGVSLAWAILVIAIYYIIFILVTFQAFSRRDV